MNISMTFGPKIEPEAYDYLDPDDEHYYVRVWTDEDPYDGMQWSVDGVGSDGRVTEDCYTFDTFEEAWAEAEAWQKERGDV